MQSFCINQGLGEIAAPAARCGEWRRYGPVPCIPSGLAGVEAAANAFPPGPIDRCSGPTSGINELTGPSKGTHRLVLLRPESAWALHIFDGCSCLILPRINGAYSIFAGFFISGYFFSKKSYWQTLSRINQVAYGSSLNSLDCKLRTWGG